MNPEVSIITINRNNAKGLENTLKSIENQTYKNFELIVIDGNSSDKSVDVINQHTPIINYWISEPDKGIYNAMNKGIAKATGTFCLFLNSGDCLAQKNSLEIFSNNIAENIDIYYGNIKYENDAKEYEFNNHLSILDFVNNSIGHGASFIKTDLFEKFGNYNEENKIISDSEFFIKTIIVNNISYKHINELITIYQDGGVSVNPTFGLTTVKEREDAIKRLCPHYYQLIVDYQTTRDKYNYLIKTKPYKLYLRLKKIKSYITGKSNSKTLQ